MSAELDQVAAEAARLELRALRPLLAAAYQLLGADHSAMGDEEAEAAHQLVRIALRRLDEAIEEARAVPQAVRQ